MRTHAKNVLEMWKVSRKKNTRRIAPPPHLYSLRTMPRVDSHIHCKSADGDWVKGSREYLRIMNQAGINVSVSLTGTRENLEPCAEATRKCKGRLLFAPRTGLRRDPKLWWNKKDLEQFAEMGLPGLKIISKYKQCLLKKSIVKTVGQQAEFGLPCIGLHVVDPPSPHFWQPNYWDTIKDTEKLIRVNPDVTFIMAHGFWLMNTDEGLDILGTYFDCYPNLNVDLSAVFQWWDGPEPTYDKLRNFIIKYKGRLLYGTDGNQNYSRKHHFLNTYKVLESNEKHLHGFFTGPKARTHITGLALPGNVLNYIYYWNAARLIPAVRKSLRGLGYKV